jgi:lycopene cyclase domain-containing protein
VPSARARGAALWVAGHRGGHRAGAGRGQLRYLGLLLLWIGPPMALQRAVAGDLLRARRRARLVVALPCALWLCAADRLALADGIWAITPASSTGVLLLGLPLEEACSSC